MALFDEKSKKRYLTVCEDFISCCSRGDTASNPSPIVQQNMRSHSVIIFDPRRKEATKINTIIILNSTAISIYLLGSKRYFDVK